MEVDQIDQIEAGKLEAKKEQFYGFCFLEFLKFIKINEISINA